MASEPARKQVIGVLVARGFASWSYLARQLGYWIHAHLDDGRKHVVMMDSSVFFQDEIRSIPALRRHYVRPTEPMSSSIIQHLQESVWDRVLCFYPCVHMYAAARVCFPPSPHVKSKTKVWIHGPPCHVDGNVPCKWLKEHVDHLRTTPVDISDSDTIASSCPHVLGPIGTTRDSMTEMERIEFDACFRRVSEAMLPRMIRRLESVEHEHAS